MMDGTHAMRAVTGRLFNRVVTAGTGLGLPDTQCGFKAFRTPAARLLFHLVRIDRFAFDVEVLVRARRLGLRVAQVPVHWRHVPGSTIHPLHDPISMLGDVCRSRLGLLPAPAVPSVVVRDPKGILGGGPLAERVGPVVGAALGGLPVPVVADGSSALVLLPLVDPAGATDLVSALRAALEPLEVLRRAMTAEALVALGPLSGRLRAPADPDRVE